MSIGNEAAVGYQVNVATALEWQRDAATPAGETPAFRPLRSRAASTRDPHRER
jgi:hypothetical protein